jgi:serine protease Do
VNLRGEVVGINSVKVAQVGVEGMGYAISVNEAMQVIEQLKSRVSG